ncbi:MAG: alpha-glucan family phosphorylase [Planctomycetota bacterium]
MPNPDRVIAYFTMEIGLGDALPTYCGGLGILAGDTVRAAADLRLPMVGVCLCYRKGFFEQSFDRTGRQKEADAKWDPAEVLEEMPQRAFVPIEGRNVIVRCFRMFVEGATSGRVPVYFLDTDLPENEPQDRSITHRLYQGDHVQQLKQRAVLGIAGPRMLRALTHDVDVFHMNEGHGFLLTLELMSEHLSRYNKFDIDDATIAAAKDRVVFTTHTPIPAGHDRYALSDVKRVVGDHPLWKRADLIGGKSKLNATVLSLNLSRYANGVARRHGEVSREMFPGYDIDSVTNGVHAATWASPPMRKLFDRWTPEWRTHNQDLRMANAIDDASLLRAHDEAKQDLLGHVFQRTGVQLDPRRFTIVFARRATPYKRPDLVISDPERLRAMSKDIYPIQILFAGKSHPGDEAGKDMIQRIVHTGRDLAPDVPIVFIPNYDQLFGAKLTAGADLWLNNPEPPKEASGTSGMKAALNGVPSLSTLDGWWIEGHVENVTGWSIDGDTESQHIASLYDKLESEILPTFRDDQPYWAEIMRSCISLNGSHFTTERMLKDYTTHAYLD